MAAVATENITEPLPEEPETSPLSPMGRRRPTYRSLSSLSPRYRCSSPKDAERPHFLDACALCKKPLGGNHDIFMYRGNTPFCSEECRQEQIEMDETKDRKWSNLAMKALARVGKAKEEGVHVRAAGTVVAG